MKIVVQMKDPDTLDDAIKEAAEESIENTDLPKDEWRALAEIRAGKWRQLARTWWEYGEYLRVEIDTEAGTCTVLEVKR